MRNESHSEMDISVVEGYLPGAIGRITELHAEYYTKHWGFGLYFEAKVACELAAFLNRYEQGRDGFWCVTRRGRIEGGITIDGIEAAEEGAHLRWFILAGDLTGSGLGHRLVQTALNFCRSADYKTVYLWTFEGLDAARHLYEKYGFRLDCENKGVQWGKPVIEQKFICRL